MKCREVIRILNELSPENCACDWDNVGLLAGSSEKETRCIYVALDATDETIEEAISSGADLLLTHHPLIFKGLKRVSEEDFIGRRIMALIRHDMAYYAMHTNFDVTVMADLAADRLQLGDTAVLQVTGSLPEKEAGEAMPIGIGMTGILPRPMELGACIRYVKEVFCVEHVKVFAGERTSGLWNSRISRIAVCPGSGKGVIEDAIKAGAQVLVTGDIDHHEGIDAAARGMAVIDAGHYGLEKFFIPFMKQYIEGRLPQIKVIAQGEKQPFVIL